MGAARRIDYTRMELGTVTWRHGAHMRVIARCAKCGRRGERGVSLPAPTDGMVPTERPHLMWHHKASQRNGYLGPMLTFTEGCQIRVDKTNVDDLLKVSERKGYDAFVAQLRAYVDQF